MHNNEPRKAFEEWFLSTNQGYSGNLMRNSGTDDYCWERTQARWMCWEAAWQARGEQIKQVLESPESIKDIGSIIQYEAEHDEGHCSIDNIDATAKAALSAIKQKLGVV